MVLSRQVEIPFYRGFSRQRERRFSPLAQVIWRAAFSFLRKYIVPTAKRVSVDLLEFAAPKTAELVSGRKKFKTAAKSVGKHTLRKQLGTGSRKRTASKVFSTKSAKQTSRSSRDSFANISHELCRAVFATNLFRQFL